MSQTCLKLKDDEILLNLSKQHKMQGRKGKCKDDIKSYFLDRFEQVEQSQNKLFILIYRLFI